MAKFHVKLSARAKKAGSDLAMFDAMYADREKLETIFRFFDADGNGSISREEFHRVRQTCLFFRGRGGEMGGGGGCARDGARLEALITDLAFHQYRYGAIDMPGFRRAGCVFTRVTGAAILVVRSRFARATVCAATGTP